MEFYSFYGHWHRFMVVLIFTDFLIQDISNLIGFQMVQGMRNCYFFSFFKSTEAECEYFKKMIPYLDFKAFSNSLKLITFDICVSTLNSCCFGT